MQTPRREGILPTITLINHDWCARLLCQLFKLILHDESIGKEMSDEFRRYLLANRGRIVAANIMVVAAYSFLVYWVLTEAPILMETKYRHSAPYVVIILPIIYPFVMYLDFKWWLKQ